MRDPYVSLFESAERRAEFRTDIASRIALSRRAIMDSHQTLIEADAVLQGGGKVFHYAVRRA